LLPGGDSLPTWTPVEESPNDSLPTAFLDRFREIPVLPLLSFKVFERFLAGQHGAHSRHPPLDPLTFYYTTHENPERLSSIKSEREIRKELFDVLEVLKRWAKSWRRELHL
jgi:hypothetical protein